MAQNTPNKLTTNQALAALERNLHRAKRQRLELQSLEAQLKMLSARRRVARAAIQGNNRGRA